MGRMNDLHKFRIHAPMNPNEAFVEMDGERMMGVTRVQFDLSARQAVEVKLTIVGFVEITGEFDETEIIRVERVPRQDSRVTVTSPPQDTPIA